MRKCAARLAKASPLSRGAHLPNQTWRYDSGLVVSGVPDAGAALIGGLAGMTPNQQVSIGLACNGVFATV